MEGFALVTRAEKRDHPLDLSPAAIMDDVAEAAATARPLRGLAAGEFAEPPDELVGVGRRRAVREVDMVTQETSSPFFSAARPKRELLPIGPAKLLNAAFTTVLGSGGHRCHEAAMNRRPDRNARSGGALLALGVIAGAIGGIIAGEPSLGFLAGLAAGLFALFLIWIADRRRAG